MCSLMKFVSITVAAGAPIDRRKLQGGAFPAKPTLTSIFLDSENATLENATENANLDGTVEPYGFIGEVDYKDVHKYVSFLVFGRNHPKDGTNVAAGKCKPGVVDTSKKTKVAVHGFTDAGEPFARRGRWDSAWANQDDVELVVVDWSPLSAHYWWDFIKPFSYRASARNSIQVGKYVAHCLTEMGIKGGNLHLFGHSLGAQSIGKMGRELAKLNNKPARATGIDAAGPRFVPNKLPLPLPVDPKLEKIDKNSAEFVDIIHTNGGEFGARQRLGHVDYYVNGGGRRQRLCKHGDEHGYSVKVVMAALRNETQKCFSGKLDIDAAPIFSKTGRTSKFNLEIGKIRPQGAYYVKSDTEC